MGRGWWEYIILDKRGTCKIK